MGHAKTVASKFCSSLTRWCVALRGKGIGSVLTPAQKQGYSHGIGMVTIWNMVLTPAQKQGYSHDADLTGMLCRVLTPAQKQGYSHRRF